MTQVISGTAHCLGSASGLPLDPEAPFLMPSSILFPILFFSFLSSSTSLSQHAQYAHVQYAHAHNILLLLDLRLNRTATLQTYSNHDVATRQQIGQLLPVIVRLLLDCIPTPVHFCPLSCSTVLHITPYASRTECMRIVVPQVKARRSKCSERAACSVVRTES